MLLAILCWAAVSKDAYGEARTVRLSNRGHILQIVSLTCSDGPYTASYVQNEAG